MAAKPKAKSYAQLSAELAKIMEWFDGGEIDLDQAMDKYQQANELIKEMENYLKTASNQVKKLQK